MLLKLKSRRACQKQQFLFQKGDRFTRTLMLNSPTGTKMVRSLFLTAVVCVRVSVCVFFFFHGGNIKIKNPPPFLILVLHLETANSAQKQSNQKLNFTFSTRVPVTAEMTQHCGGGLIHCNFSVSTR